MDRPAGGEDSTSGNGCCYWLADDFRNESKAEAEEGHHNRQPPPLPTSICVGTGRFLRSVLVPLLPPPVVLLQTRGQSFVEYMQERQRHSSTDPSTTTYEVDTVLPTGVIRTETVACAGAFSLGRDKTSVYTVLLPKILSNGGIFIIGVGVTEGGMARAETTAMKDLYELFTKILDYRQHHHNDNEPCNTLTKKKICVINTDNVPNNGDVLKSHMYTLATGGSNPEMIDFLQNSVAFLNTMVDRITSHRENDLLVPRAEPIPAKALVVLDEHGDLPDAFSVQHQQSPSKGLIIRQKASELQADLALKLRIANGTHTALAHLMALCRLPQTDVLSSCSDTTSVVLDYLDALVEGQILPATAGIADLAAAQAVWQDWRMRLTHPHFGLSTFFITQNGAQKAGIRLGPTVLGTMENRCGNLSVTGAMVAALAVMLRWLTPVSAEPADGIFTGWLNGSSRGAIATLTNDGATLSSSSSAVEYADALRYDLVAGWYEFRCGCNVVIDGGLMERSVSAWLGSFQTPQQPAAYAPVIRAYLIAESGGALARASSSSELEVLVHAVATLYARMIAGDDLLDLWKELRDGGVFSAGMHT